MGRRFGKLLSKGSEKKFFVIFLQLNISLKLVAKKQTRQERQ